MRLSVAALAAFVIVAAGCGSTPEQAGAERAVAAKAGSEARCTSRSSTWFRDGPPAKVMLCVVDRDDGVCDRYRVDRAGGDYRVTLLNRASDCALPAG